MIEIFMFPIGGILKDILIDKYGYPDLQGIIGQFTKAKTIVLTRSEIERIVIEYYNSEKEEEREYYLLVLHSAAINVVRRLLRMKSLRDPLKGGFEDLSQELFIVLCDSLDRYNYDNTDYDFYGFFVYEVRNHFRDRKPIRELYKPDIECVGCKLSASKLLMVEVEEYLRKKLNERQYKVLVLKSGIYGKFNNDEIADMLGVNEKTVRRDWEFSRTYLREDRTLKEFLKGEC